MIDCFMSRNEEPLDEECLNEIKPEVESVYWADRGISHTKIEESNIAGISVYVSTLGYTRKALFPGEKPILTGPNSIPMIANPNTTGQIELPPQDRFLGKRALIDPTVRQPDTWKDSGRITGNESTATLMSTPNSTRACERPETSSQSMGSVSHTIAAVKTEEVPGSEEARLDDPPYCPSLGALLLLGKQLEPAIAKFYKRRCIPNDPNILFLTDQEVPKKEKSYYGCYRPDGLLKTKEDSQRLLISPNTPVKRIPLEYKVSAFDFLQDAHYRLQNPGKIRQRPTPDLKSLLERRKILQNGQLNILHAFGYQASVYAAAEHENTTTKCVELLVLTPYGLYRHRQLISMQVVEKLENLWVSTTELVAQLKTLEKILQKHPGSSDSFVQNLLLKNFPKGLKYSIQIMREQLRSLKVNRGELSAATKDKDLLKDFILNPPSSRTMDKNVEPAEHPLLLEICREQQQGRKFARTFDITKVLLRNPGRTILIIRNGNVANIRQPAHKVSEAR